MLKSLNSQQTLKNDQCPKNVLDVTRALSQHKWGNGWDKKTINRNNGTNVDAKDEDKREEDNKFSSFNQHVNVWHVVIRITQKNVVLN